ncbi:MAG: hypothetical protein DSZ32_05605 [Gammaproteobacteria bacterium]|nr:MAG: hypothetical protein DSZ32_05605 [Gammaproteobacteria bacterium]
MASVNNKIVNIGFFPGFSLFMAIIGILLMLFGQHLAQPTESDREQFVTAPDAEFSQAGPSMSSDRFKGQQVKSVKNIWL